MRVLMLIFIVCFLQGSSCKRENGECPAAYLGKSDDRLTIVNNSSEKIAYRISHDYPDDSLVLKIYVPGEQEINANPAGNVAANSSKKDIITGCWESTFMNHIPSGKLHILIFNIDSVKAYPAAEIISRGLYKSYLYTLDELKANDWQVVYP
jgi:hypothetical protein